MDQELPVKKDEIKSVKVLLGNVTWQGWPVLEKATQTIDSEGEEFLQLNKQVERLLARTCLLEMSMKSVPTYERKLVKLPGGLSIAALYNILTKIHTEAWTSHEELRSKVVHLNAILKAGGGPGPVRYLFPLVPAIVNLVVVLRAYLYRLLKIADLLIARNESENVAGICNADDEALLVKVRAYQKVLITFTENVESVCIRPTMMFCVSTTIDASEGAQRLSLVWDKNREEFEKQGSSCDIPVVPSDVGWYYSTVYQAYRILLKDVPGLGTFFTCF
ncbi:hypothetical protein BJ508DRAFT_341922 [Ascobolus immersus RN42]|uniref:Uncharacterized protein n=1 Tax=Ascobolus immersus RN42 TaxID=1160509 RepID=A0A3N4HG12_ASCIM|nr:hypothetical protein BJ508DRAFT_341922 [Ascobolus immersus RN42]